MTFTVGFDQKANINRAVKKVQHEKDQIISFARDLLGVSTLDLSFLFYFLQFSGDFTIMLFHYDGRVTEWDEFEWSKTAIHVSAPKQTKWYAHFGREICVTVLHVLCYLLAIEMFMSVHQSERNGMHILAEKLCNSASCIM